MSFDPSPFQVIAFVVVLTLLIGVLANWWAQRKFKPFELVTENIEAGGWTFRYHQSGRGPHLLLLHGIGANLYCWRWIIPILALDFKVTAIDLPGFGGSSKPKGASYGLDDQCARIEELLNTLNIRQTYVIGNSMGGNIALWLAHTKAARILGVGVIAPATSPKLIPFDLQKWAWLSGAASIVLTRTAIRWAHRRTVTRKEKVDHTRVEESFRTYGRQPDAVRSFIRATEAIRDSRLPGDLRGLKSKVLLLWGSSDVLVSKKVINELESALPEAESHVHDGGGHHLQEDEPEWVSQKIVEFFSRKPDL